MSKFNLPLRDFNRIHQVIHGTLKDEGNPGKACTFFSMIGSLILNKHYKIPARPVAGGFALCVGPEQHMLFGRDAGGKVEFDADGFHMWVQTETHIIDFMSPLFHEAFADVQNDVTIPRRMFQKRFSDEASNIDAMNNPGDFYTMPDPELTDYLIDSILARPLNTDMIEIADTWFGSARGKQKPSLTIQSNDGIIRQLTLPNSVARSAW